jgi:hypothetical protein
MKIIARSKQVGPKFKTTTAKVRPGNQPRPFQVIEILSITQPRRSLSRSCSPWGPWWLFHEAKQSRNEDSCSRQVGPKIKTTTAKVRPENIHRPFQVIEILSITQPRGSLSSLCSPWGAWWLFHEAKQSINEDSCSQQVGPKIKTTTAKVRPENIHRPFQVIEILSIIPPRRIPSSLCSPWGAW